ncbi:MAG: LptF/LptG family permease [Victivallaceae bacterium]
MKLWTRYLLLRFWSIFTLLFLGTVLFYASVHFSLHAVRNGGPKNCSPLTVVLYYLSEVMLKNEFILSQLVSVSVVIVLSSMQSKREILLLRASGLSLRRILSPLIISGFIVISFLYCHFEWIFPVCKHNVSELNPFASDKKKNKLPVFYLKDQSVLLCSSLEAESMILKEVFWIKTFDKIYKIQEIQFTSEHPPLGKEILYFKRNSEDKICLDTSYETKYLPELEFGNLENPFSKTFVSKNRNKLSEIFKSIVWKEAFYGTKINISPRLADLITQFYYKLFSPLICLAAVIIPASFCLRFNRLQTYSKAYLFSLLILNLFFLCFNALCILSKHNIIPALQSTLVPITLLLVFTLGKFVKINR